MTDFMVILSPAYPGGVRGVVKVFAFPFREISVWFFACVHSMNSTMPYFRVAFPADDRSGSTLPRGLWDFRTGQQDISILISVPNPPCLIE